MSFWTFYCTLDALQDFAGLITLKFSHSILYTNTTATNKSNRGFEETTREARLKAGLCVPGQKIGHFLWQRPSLTLLPFLQMKHCQTITIHCPHLAYPCYSRPNSMDVIKFILYHSTLHHHHISK
jgi:hypothetical protein